jgi:hypothetical protein
MPSPVHPYSDYGVALRTLRSARGWLAWLLAFCVVAQMVGFTMMRYTQQPYKSMKPGFEYTYLDKLRRLIHPTTAPDSQPAVTGSDPLSDTDYSPPLTSEGRRLNVRTQWNTTYVICVAATQVVGLLAAASQMLIVFVTLLVMLVAQAPGVAHVTRALIWAVLLWFMVLPWQFFARDFPIPGVLYGYQEMLRLIGPHVVGETVTGFDRLQLLGRFVVYPLASLFFLLMMSERFRAGLMLAIGHPLQSMMQPRLGATGPSLLPKTTPPAPEKKLG